MSSSFIANEISSINKSKLEQRYHFLKDKIDFVTQAIVISFESLEKKSKEGDINQDDLNNILSEIIDLINTSVSEDQFKDELLSLLTDLLKDPSL